MTQDHQSLMLGDCMEILPKMEPSSIDLIVTSPPYNLGIRYNSYADDSSRSDYLAWCRSWATELHRVMGENASFFLNVGSAPTNPLMPHQLILELTGGDKPLFFLQNTFHWVKSITVRTPDGQSTSAGHFKPINSKRYVNDCHEFVFHLTKSGNVQLDRRAAGVPYVHKSNIARWGHTLGQDLRCRGNVWFIPYETIKSRNNERPHPATFPVELAQLCILLHGNNSQTRMLDPFLGIGSSSIAAEIEKIAHFTGIEIDESYLDTAKARLAEHRQDAAEQLSLV